MKQAEHWAKTLMRRTDTSTWSSNSECTSNRIRHPMAATRDWQKRVETCRLPTLRGNWTANWRCRPTAVGRRPRITGGKLTLRRYNIVMGIQYAWHSDDRYYATVVKNQYRQFAIAPSFTFASGHNLDLSFRSHAVGGLGFSDEIDFLRSHHRSRLCLFRLW